MLSLLNGQRLRCRVPVRALSSTRGRVGDASAGRPSRPTPRGARRASGSGLWRDDDQSLCAVEHGGRAVYETGFVTLRSRGAWAKSDEKHPRRSPLALLAVRIPRHLLSLRGGVAGVPHGAHGTRWLERTRGRGHNRAYMLSSTPTGSPPDRAEVPPLFELQNVHFPVPQGDDTQYRHRQDGWRGDAPAHDQPVGQLPREQGSGERRLPGHLGCHSARAVRWWRPVRIGPHVTRTTQLSSPKHWWGVV